jgi:hypothetical protein
MAAPSPLIQISPDDILDTVREPMIVLDANYESAVLITPFISSFGWRLKSAKAD